MVHGQGKAPHVLQAEPPPIQSRHPLPFKWVPFKCSIECCFTAGHPTSVFCFLFLFLFLSLFLPVLVFIAFLFLFFSLPVLVSVPPLRD